MSDGDEHFQTFAEAARIGIAKARTEGAELVVHKAWCASRRSRPCQCNVVVIAPTDPRSIDEIVASLDPEDH